MDTPPCPTLNTQHAQKNSNPQGLLKAPGHALHNGRYPKLRREQRRGAVQRPGASVANGRRRVCMSGLCYDTQPGEAVFGRYA
jgi:hypothetical protein